MKLKFLGDGSAFNYDALNTSAYIKEGDTFYLFDCGESICNRILKLKLLEGVENIYVFITHTHSDHIGSLEALQYYNEVFLKKNFKIFYPDKANLKLLLELTGVDFPFEIYDVPSELEKYRIDYVTQNHIPGSYGYFFYKKDETGESFFYSGDASTVNKRAEDELKNGQIDYLFHEVTDTDSPIHTHISKLEESFPEELRDRVYLMHFSNEAQRELCRSKKFKVVEVVTNE